MTTADYKKGAEQLRPKPAKLNKFLKHGKKQDRACGKTKYKCTKCGRYGAHIQKYGLHLCRQCFRDIATELGFKKYS
ncbi:MAG TPA: 30S ribosomal protein S14 [Candidatus Woesearchaeota archaeon]|nr:30S ribosomal protein S14 [Candidatus Woesearchaeota archaeon]